MDYPAKITAVEIQQKNKNRVSIFLDNDFAFGLDATIVAQHGLKKGDCLTKAQITHILLREERKRIKDRAYRYLAARAHSEKELTTKLVQKGFDKKLIDEVIAELKELNFVDDLAFAVSYARNRIIKKPIGEKLLRRELWQRGINEELVEKAVQEAYSAKTQTDLAKELVKGREARYANLEDWRTKKKLGDFLLRRGFDWDLVREVLQGET